jgi:hypothetical protein
MKQAMKKLSSILLILSIFVTYSCRDEDLYPYPEVETQNSQGAFLRIVEVPSGIFDLNNIGNSSFQMTLEAEDNPSDKGTLTASVEFTVQFVDNTPGNGDASVAATAWTTVNASSFTVDSETGLPRYNVNVSANEVLTLLSLTPADLDGGDRFRFEWTQVLTDGREFNRLNSSNSVQGETYYSSPYLLDVGVVCLLPDGFATGDYSLVQTVGSPDPFFGAPTKFAEGTVTLTEGSTPTQRDFDVGYISFALDMTIDLVCGNVQIPQQNSGVGCGGAVVWATSVAQGAAPHDVTNDAVLVINLTDDLVNDCGLNEEMVLTLTKL